MLLQVTKVAKALAVPTPVASRAEQEVTQVHFNTRIEYFCRFAWVLMAKVKQSACTVHALVLHAPFTRMQLI